MPVLPYSAEELSERIAEQSVDMNRLAATVAGIQKSVAALADWANAQIQAQAQVPTQASPADSGSADTEGQGRKKR